MRLVPPLVAFSCLWVVGIGLSAPPTEVTTAKRPAVASTAEPERIVAGYFQRQPDYQPGDLINRGDARAIFQEVEKAGFTIADRQSLLERVPDRDEPLVQLMLSEAGQAFMRQIAQMPQGYDRVDRLLKLPHGWQTVHDLARGPDGYKMIQYMTRSAGGRNMGRMLSQAPGGENFNQPTGRIYTAQMLASELKKSAHPGSLKSAGAARSR